MTRVVIMAGGRGTRLHPLTEHTPKPLVRVGRKPMLQTIIEQFAAQGFVRFTLCVNYKAELIEEWFGDGAKMGVSIDYSRETEPLGTAGGLRLIDRPERRFIVANADVLAQIDYNDLLAHHDGRNAIATMCLAYHQHQVPYGVAHTEGGFVARISEKPIESWLVNAGIYVCEPRLIDEIPLGRCDMTDLLGKAGGFVSAYEMDGYWHDIGTFQSLEQAEAMLS